MSTVHKIQKQKWNIGKSKHRKQGTTKKTCYKHNKIVDWTLDIKVCTWEYKMYIKWVHVGLHERRASLSFLSVYHFCTNATTKTNTTKIYICSLPLLPLKTLTNIIFLVVFSMHYLWMCNAYYLHFIILCVHELTSLRESVFEPVFLF